MSIEQVHSKWLGSAVISSLKATRISLNMTQEQMAAEFGVSSTTLARWEQGKSVPDGMGMLKLALEALEAKHQLKNPDFLSKKEAIRQSIIATNNRLRQRVRHPRVRQISTPNPASSEKVE